MRSEQAEQATPQMQIHVGARLMAGQTTKPTFQRHSDPPHAPQNIGPLGDSWGRGWALCSQTKTQLHTRNQNHLLSIKFFSNQPNLWLVGLARGPPGTVTQELQ